MFGRRGSGGRGAAYAAALSVLACNAVLGNEDRRLVGRDAGLTSCLLKSDCPEGDVCLFETCSKPCREDVDCDDGYRCLETATGVACVSPEQSACNDSACPEGTECGGGVCRTGCGAGDACRDDQTCLNGTCVGTDVTHDPGNVVQGSGGNSGAGGAPPGTGGNLGSGGATNSGGVPGAGGDSGNGGFPGGGGVLGAGGDPGAGAPGSGGVPGAGGAGSGGASGAGGAGSGGAPGTGGSFGTGGSPGTGGSGGGATCCPSGNCLCHGPAPTALTSDSGPFDTATFTVSTGTVHYPTDANPPFAGVAICPGFTNTGPEMTPWGEFFASHGIVTVVTSTGGSDQPAVRATKLLASVAAMKAENTRSGSPLFGRMSNRYGTSGYSMGGGGTTIASVTDPTLRTSVGLAAWSPVTSGIQVPTLLLCGTADNVAPCSMSQNAYDGITGATLKMMISIQGSTHFNWFGPADAGGGTSGKYALAFQKVFLEGDERWRALLLQDPSNGTRTTNIQ